MKKYILSLALICSLALITQAQIAVTAYQRNGASVTTADSAMVLVPEQINRVYSENGKVYVEYGMANNRAKYTVRQTVAAIYADANSYAVNLIALTLAKVISSTDSSRYTLYNVGQIIDLKPRSHSSLSAAVTKMNYRDIFGNQSFVVEPIIETNAVITLRLDSLYSAKQTPASKRRDTATATQTFYNTNIVLDGATADTLTMLNPAIFYDRLTPLVISNVGSGTWTLNGGYTIKNTAGSTVTTIAANNTYRLNAVSDGSSGYIWLKE